MRCRVPDAHGVSGPDTSDASKTPCAFSGTASV